LPDPRPFPPDPSTESHHGTEASDTVRLSRRALLGTGAATLAGLSLGASAATAGPKRGKPVVEGPFGPVVVADPGGRVLYPRAVRLGESSSFLATFQRFDKPSYEIYRSDDGGRTWRAYSNVPNLDEVEGSWYHPFLYQLPHAFAGLPKGALLFAGNSVGDRTRTRIDVYASLDTGRTWRFVSTVAEGGPPIAQNGATPVWEPFLLLHRNRLICYYSDQRDPKHGQKLAHQTSTDLRTWGPVVNDAADPDYDLRPGMTTVARLRSDLWIMTYENGNDTTGHPYAVRYRLAEDPELFDSAPDYVLQDQDGYIPSAAPTVSWSDSGGPTGTIVVSANSDQDLFLNRHLGDPGKWTRVPSTVPGGYSRITIPLQGRGRGLVFVLTGQYYDDQVGPVQAGVVQLP
jgi:hypothetical protein